MNKKQFLVINNNAKGKIDEIEYIASGFYEEKKSKFYAYIFEITETNQVQKILNSAKKHFKDARHIVYAYILENEYYFCDDGEPSGTGGKAIYALLEKQNVVNTLVIVIRYFGGILLGVGPLSRAYLKAVKNAEENLDIVDYVPKTTIKIKCSYNGEPYLRNLIEKSESNIINVEYAESIIYTILTLDSKKDIFKDYENC